MLSRALPGAHVVAYLEGQEVARADTDAQGRFVLDVDGPLSVLARADRAARRWPHWTVTLEVNAPGFEPARSGATVPCVAGQQVQVLLTPQ